MLLLEFALEKLGHLGDLLLALFWAFLSDIGCGLGEVQDGNIGESLGELPEEFRGHKDGGGSSEEHAGPLVVLEAVFHLVVCRQMADGIVDWVPVGVLEEAVSFGELLPGSRIRLRGPAFDVCAGVTERICCSKNEFYCHLQLDHKCGDDVEEGRDEARKAVDGIVQCSDGQIARQLLQEGKREHLWSPDDTLSDLKETKICEKKGAENKKETSWPKHKKTEEELGWRRWKSELVERRRHWTVRGGAWRGCGSSHES